MRTNNWTIMAPHARLAFGLEGEDTLRNFGDTPLSSFTSELQKISGVKLKKGLWNVPLNAISVVDTLQKQFPGVSTTAAAWVTEPSRSVDWGIVGSLLRERGEVQEWVLDGFLTAYQEESIAFGWTGAGIHYWHPTGSGKTLTGLLCSLSVPGTVVVVTRAAARLQYAREIERFLNVRAYVVRPESELTGQIRVRGESRFGWLARHRRGPVRVNGESYREWQARQPKAGPIRVNGESYGEWQARNKGRFSREEMKLNWSAYKEEHGLDNPGMSRDEMKADWERHKIEHGLDNPGMSQVELSDAWKAHKEAYGIDPPRRLPDYLEECRAAARRPFIVVGWEALTANIGRLVALQPGVVIFDESHRGKSTKRWDVVHLPELPDDVVEAREVLGKYTTDARSKDGFIKDTGEEGWKMFVPVLNTAASAAHLARASKKRICTTATPVKDRVRDLWSQLDLAEPNAWGNATAFQDRYCDRKPGIYGGYDTKGSSNLDELNLRLGNVAHILAYEETHRQLPAKRRQSVYIAPGDQCRPASGFPAELREAKKRGANAMLEVRLAQAASKKRKAVLDMVVDHVSSKHKVVIFTGRKRDCDQLGEDVRKAVGKLKQPATVWSAHGEQSVTHRQNIIDEYMDHPGPCVLVGTGHSFGESLNIHDTDAAFFVMLPYTPGQLRQWEGRFTRLGQTRPVVIYYVICEDSVDEHIASILIDKLPAVQKVVKDSELAEAKDVLAGIDPNQTDDEFVDSILADLDF